IQRGLQTSGQTAFHIHYDDLADRQIIEGIAGFLGAGAGRGKPPRRGKVQNPKPLSEKVTNFKEMERSLAARDPFELDRLPIYEPVRGPNVPAFVTASKAPLLFMPIKGARDDQLRQWLAALDDKAPDELETGHSQKTLRRWLRQTRPHTVFSVIAHPLERAHTAFCRHILPGGAEPYPAIRDALVRNYKLELPQSADDAGYDAKAHRAALGRFLAFLQGNLGGQTSVRVDGAWASQTAILQAMAQIAIPERLLRADRLAEDLSAIAKLHGASAPDLAAVPEFRIGLKDIYDAELEKLAQKAYRRDYIMFGFKTWTIGR
ncbi:MAG: nodulation protein NodH, partial [Alphaproteobacteria bacterium]|nr:nodulation protein NodH [Alphaproteobacteria bacterium]